MNDVTVECDFSGCIWYILVFHVAVPDFQAICEILHIHIEMGGLCFINHSPH